jgi:hypothetical protein
MGNKLKIFLIIICFLFLGIVGFSTKVDAGGCYVAYAYGPYPGVPCSWWTPWSSYIRSCQQNNSYSSCYSWYYGGGKCYGNWYDVSCDASNCSQTVYCSGCGNSVTCPSCGSVKNCGESDCNSAPYPYCTAGNTCNGNVCQINCPAGYTRSGNCNCVPDYVPPKNCGESGCNNSSYPYCTAGNTCNGNVCQINCPAGYTRSGNCNCVPNPLACGVAGCNISGCVTGNTCDANVCKVNCPTGHDRVDNCGCRPPCSLLEAKFTRLPNSCSLDISISGASPYLLGLELLGLPVTTITPNILFRHTLTSAGTKSWTVNWQEVASVGSANRYCTMDISNPINPPSCGTVNTDISPNPLIWGEKATIKAVFSPNLCSTHNYTNILITRKNLTYISGSAFSTTCEVTPLGETSLVLNSNPHSLTFSWQLSEKACPAIVSSACSVNSDEWTSINQSGYLTTKNGVSYIGEFATLPTGEDNIAVNKQPKFSISDNFSSNIFGSLNSNLYKQLLSEKTCWPQDTLCSSKEYLLLGYLDTNSQSSWYSYLKNSLLTNSKLNILASQNNLSGMAGISGLLVDDKVNLVPVSGTMTLQAGIKCDNATIFLISGDLNITPDFTVNGLEDACLFIVGGKTTILASSKTAPNCYGEERLDTIGNPQDIIQAFIITKDFTTVKSAVQLYIKGGVITNSFDDGLNRNVNSDTCRFPNMPSELFDYEGARYIKNLKDALSSPTTLSVFEKQYKSTSQ